MALAEYQLKDEANDWWVPKKANLTEQVNWTGFKVLFFEKYFPSCTRDKMLSQLFLQKQGTRTVSEYETEFNRLMKFAPTSLKHDEPTKIQKFRDGLSPELRHDIMSCDVTSLGALINKAKMMKESHGNVRAEKDSQKTALGKRTFGSFSNKN